MTRGAAVFLPWHLYLYLPFAGRVIANPAPVYFTQPVVVSSDAEIGLPVEVTTQQYAVATLLLEGNRELTRVADQMAAADLCGILLVKTVDWKQFAFVQRIPGLRDVYRSPDIDVFVNSRHHCIS
jgi:hypothetical protein